MMFIIIVLYLVCPGIFLCQRRRAIYLDGAGRTFMTGQEDALTCNIGLTTQLMPLMTPRYMLSITDRCLVWLVLIEEKDLASICEE